MYDLIQSDCKGFLKTSAIHSLDKNKLIEINLAYY